MRKREEDKGTEMNVWVRKIMIGMIERGRDMKRKEYRGKTFPVYFLLFQHPIYHNLINKFEIYFKAPLMSILRYVMM